MRKQRQLEDSQMLEKWICIADASARDSRLKIIRSEERQKLAAIGGLEIDVTELEIPGEVIHVDQDGAFSTFRDRKNILQQLHYQ